jgi:malate dehydrogenase (oxaloacetate-decarboxylating)(NADP+)
MKIAATQALARVAREGEVPKAVLEAYGVTSLSFGPEYIIPKPLDPRVLVEESIAVAQAAMASGVARKPIADMGKYRGDLERLAERIAGAQS